MKNPFKRHPLEVQLDVMREALSAANARIEELRNENLSLHQTLLDILAVIKERKS